MKQNLLSTILLFFLLESASGNKDEVGVDERIQPKSHIYSSESERIPNKGNSIKQRPNISFYDLDYLEENKKLDVIKSIYHLRDVSDNINWDKLRESYHIQVITGEITRDDSPEYTNVNLRRRLSDDQRKVKTVKKKKKKKKKKKLFDNNIIRPSSKGKGSKGKSSKKSEKKCIERKSSKGGKGASSKSRGKSVKYTFENASRRTKMIKIKKKDDTDGSKSEGKGSIRSKSPTTKNPTTKSPKSGKGKKNSKKLPYCDETNSPYANPSQIPIPSPTISPAPSPVVSPPPEPPTSQPPSYQSPSSQPQSQRLPTQSPQVSRSPRPTISDSPTIEGDIYRYDPGNCPNEGAEGVPCSEGNLRKVCDRYNEELGSFRKCWELCEPAFCCIHDANPDTNPVAPSCSSDENCAQYAYCYIVWFKFHDTFGPAQYLNLEQEGNFFDVPNEEVRGDDKLVDGGEPFFNQLYFHHFDDYALANDAGLDSNGEFKLDILFNNKEYWDTSF